MLEVEVDRPDSEHEINLFFFGMIVGFLLGAAVMAIIWFYTFLSEAWPAYFNGLT